MLDWKTILMNMLFYSPVVLILLLLLREIIEEHRWKKVKFMASPLLTLLLLSANCLMFGLMFGSYPMVNAGGISFLVLSLVGYVVGPINLE